MTCLCWIGFLRTSPLCRMAHGPRLIDVGEQQKQMIAPNFTCTPVLSLFFASVDLIVQAVLYSYLQSVAANRRYVILCCPVLYIWVSTSVASVYVLWYGLQPSSACVRTVLCMLRWVHHTCGSGHNSPIGKELWHQ